MLKHILLVLALAFAAQSAHAQSKITTVTGGVYLGTILSEDSKEVLFRTTDSLDIRIPREKIESLSYGRVPPRTTSAQASSSDPESPRMIGNEFIGSEGSHWALGFAFGTPAAIQPVVAYYSGEWGARVSAMMLPEAVTGLQAELMKRIVKTGKLDLNVGLVSGFTVFEGDRSNYYVDESWAYAGPSLSLDLFGIYAQGGLTLGVGDFSNPQLVFQLGYAYHFR